MARKGKYDPERNSPEAKAWRKRIIKRDKYCQMPDCKSKYRLEAHHIYRWADAPMLRFDDENGITLCSRCHYRIRNNENAFIELFSDIVLAKRKKR